MNRMKNALTKYQRKLAIREAVVLAALALLSGTVIAVAIWTIQVFLCQ